MFHAVANFFNERRQGITRTAAYLGGAYLAGRYVVDRLEEVREKVMQDRLARENLRRRFEQNQQDICFTVMALLPTLGSNILEGMDVEGVTQELQSQSRSSRPTSEAAEVQVVLPQPLQSEPPPQENDNRSENGSISVVSSTSQEDGAPSDLAASSNSWVDQFSMSSSQVTSDQTPSNTGSNSQSDSPKSQVGTELSDSILTNSSAVSYDNSLVQSTPHQTLQVPKTKAELWREVKILTFTRTLTILYSTTLLSLFTHIQLNALGRSKYLQSIVQLAHEEIMREQWRDSLSLASLLWSGNMENASPEEELQEVELVDEETERMFLTLSWWILHVGWKDVGERVRRGVEEVFEGVSLKSKLNASELHRLMSDVRRRVEFEVTFEGKERRINFISTLLPPSPETLHHVLTQGGIPPRQAFTHDRVFHTLLSEARQHLSSASFQVVLEASLDKATEILFDGLEKTVFKGSPSDVVDDVSGFSGPRVRLAGMLPGLAKWCHSAVEGLPNELVDGLGSIREVNAFSAIIYSSYEDQFR
ncbi:hypothetical protein QCA50_014125 [Cerrena zonata]|uniref:Peroxisomal biogenesis factor 3 n=1 Tax=Cerrena zonata TaxID=2478898 RepID=A0AAW0FTW9_9APHY